MDTIDHSEAFLRETEQHLQRALTEEANRLVGIEPLRLAAACLAPRRSPVRKHRHLWRWAVTAAAVLLFVLHMGHVLLRTVKENTIDPFTAVSSEIDREALFAALPHIPTPTRPPPPCRMVPDVVIHTPSL